MLEAYYQELLKEITEEYCSETKGPWIVAWSGGKDSSFLLHAVVEAVLNLPSRKRKREVTVLCNDTLVESPFVQRYVDGKMKELKAYFRRRRLPFKTVMTKPVLKDSFWVNLIGKGYPAPTRNFRWCTDRMKIKPTTFYIRGITREVGHSVLLIGVRRTESTERAKIAKKFDHYEGRLNPHRSLKNASVFRPILEWTTDDVWAFLATNSPPWGDNYDDLFSLYRDAVSGECPVVIDPDAAPSCGSSSIRFGCWTCTVVAKDKSFRGSIENNSANEFEQALFYEMAEFRDWLKTVSADKTRRVGIRRNGQDGVGPMKIDLRKEIMRKVIRIQKAVGFSLISDEEIAEIKRIWRVDEAMFSAYFRFRDRKGERENKNEFQEINC